MVVMIVTCFATSSAPKLTLLDYVGKNQSAPFRYELFLFFSVVDHGPPGSALRSQSQSGVKDR